MKAEVRAKYITKWDDGRTILESPCKVTIYSQSVLKYTLRGKKIWKRPENNLWQP